MFISKMRLSVLVLLVFCTYVISSCAAQAQESESPLRTPIPPIISINDYLLAPISADHDMNTPLHGAVESCLLEQGIKDGIPAALLAQLVDIDVADLVEVPDYRQPPTEQGYVLIGSETGSSELTEAEMMLLSENGFREALFGTAVNDSFQLDDGDGCIARGLYEVLGQVIDPIYLEAVSEMIDINEVIWHEYSTFWSSCMHERGYMYEFVSDPYLEFRDLEVTENELQTAVDDRECREEVQSHPEFEEILGELRSAADSLFDEVPDNNDNS